MYILKGCSTRMSVARNVDFVPMCNIEVLGWPENPQKMEVRQFELWCPWILALCRTFRPLILQMCSKLRSCSRATMGCVAKLKAFSFQGKFPHCLSSAEWFHLRVYTRVYGDKVILLPYFKKMYDWGPTSWIKRQRLVVVICGSDPTLKVNCPGSLLLLGNLWPSAPTSEN